jgi:hypothetical protein
MYPYRVIVVNALQPINTLESIVWIEGDDTNVVRAEQL